MRARAAGLIAIFMLALAPVVAEASRKLSISDLAVPRTGHAGEPLAVSGTVGNSGDQKARATVRVYVKDTVGQMRIGGRKFGLAAGGHRAFSMSPVLPDTTPEGDYQVVVCAQRVNNSGTPRCRTAPLTIDG